MTLNAHKALDDYFHAIINPNEKEPTMLEKIKSFVLDFLTKPNPDVVTEITEHRSGDESVKDKMVIEMYTDSYYCSEREEHVPPVHTVYYSDMDTSWPTLIDAFIDELEKHFGYPIKEQVYYSVKFPINHPDVPSCGRQINDEKFQLLLLTHPELYENEFSL